MALGGVRAQNANSDDRSRLTAAVRARHADRQPLAIADLRLRRRREPPAYPQPEGWSLAVLSASRDDTRRWSADIAHCAMVGPVHFEQGEVLSSLAATAVLKVLAVERW